MSGRGRQIRTNTRKSTMTGRKTPNALTAGEQYACDLNSHEFSYPNANVPG